MARRSHATIRLGVCSWEECVAKVGGTSSESPKTGNIRIRRIEFLNQNSLFGLDLEKVFFAPGLKIVLQHYREQSRHRPTEVFTSAFDP